MDGVRGDFLGPPHGTTKHLRKAEIQNSHALTIHWIDSRMHPTTKNFHFTCCLIELYFLDELTTKILEPPRGKTNNVVFEQVRHKPACTVTEKS